VKSTIHKIAREIHQQGGEGFYVGGYVRDRLLGRESLDFDIEVYGLELRSLEKLIQRHGRVEAVGRSFGVLKFFSPAGLADFSLPRRENKEGRGHRGFVVDLDPDLKPAEASARRDFTINAMLENVLTGQVLDFHDGKRDLEQGILRHCGDSFGEDPLRAYRLMQFAARLEMTPAPETLALCRQMDLSELPHERIMAEFEKLLLLGNRPSLGLNAALAAGVLEYHPPLKAMVDCPQDPGWHPEGDVWTHTLMCLDAAADLRRGERRSDLAMMLGVLCHDLGKPLTTGTKGTRIVSPGHAEAGARPTREFLAGLTGDQDLVEQVVKFVLYHLRPSDFYRVRHEIGNGSIRRLSTQVNIEELLRVSRADHLGRDTEDARRGDYPAGDWLLAKARELSVESAPPGPLLLGRHLLQRGWTAGPLMGKVLKKAFEAQIEGEFSDLDGALVWLESRKRG
jgi:tRNA nucleotidyltransferase (CCA-adding enzyme)